MSWFLKTTVSKMKKHTMHKTKQNIHPQERNGCHETQHNTKIHSSYTI